MNSSRKILCYTRQNTNKFGSATLGKTQTSLVLLSFAREFITLRSSLFTKNNIRYEQLKI
jgi:hypothetical protein